MNLGTMTTDDQASGEPVHETTTGFSGDAGLAQTAVWVGLEQVDVTAMGPNARLCGMGAGCIQPTLLVMAVALTRTGSASVRR